MPITEGHYNVILKGLSNSSDDVVNSFYFDVIDRGSPLAGDDAELFNIGLKLWNKIKGNLRDVTSIAIDYKTVEVFKADGSDVGASGFYTIPAGEGVGTVGGDVLPPFVCWSFQYTRPNANFRHGYKRFAGVPESMQSNGAASSGAATILNALAADLRSDIDLPSIGTGGWYMEFALVQRIKNGVAVDPDVWYKPSTVAYKKIGSQNTRKYNVGS